MVKEGREYDVELDFESDEDEEGEIINKSEDRVENATRDERKIEGMDHNELDDGDDSEEDDKEEGSDKCGEDDEGEGSNDPLITTLPFLHVIESPRWNIATDDGRIEAVQGFLSLRMYLEENPL